MEKTPWATLLLSIAVLTAGYYGLVLLYFNRLRRRKVPSLIQPQSLFQTGLSNPSTVSLIETKNIATEQFLLQTTPPTPLPVEEKEITLHFTDTEAISLTEQELPTEEGIDLEKLITTFELASQKAVTEKEREEIAQTVTDYSSDAYFQEILNNHETIKQKVQKAFSGLSMSNKDDDALLHFSSAAVFA